MFNAASLTMLLILATLFFVMRAALTMNVTRDLIHRIQSTETLYPVAVTANKAKDVGVDLIDYDSAMFLVNVGAIAGAGLVTPVAQECDTLGGTYTDVAAGDLDGAFVACVANTQQKVGYKGVKRFVAVRAAYTSGTSVVLGGSIIAGHPHQQATA